MRVLRTLVLLLVCMLLPFRGAVAATMLCAEPEPAGQLTAAVGHAHHGVGSDHDHVHSGAPHDGHDQADQDRASADNSVTSDSCHICASGCHAAAILTTLPSAPAAGLVASVVFPALRVPAPAFESEGQDRPPRAI